MMLQEVWFRDTVQVKCQLFTTGLDKNGTAMRNEVIETQDIRHQDEQDNWNGDTELNMGEGERGGIRSLRYMRGI